MTDHADDTVDLEASLATLESPGDAAIAQRGSAERVFLHTHVFLGLNDLKPAFDSHLIAHFRAADFLEVIARCNLLGVRIIGVEVCGSQGEDVAIEFGEGDSNAWCGALVAEHQDRIDLSFCATYAVPDRLLGMPPR